MRVYQEATIGVAIATLSREGTLDCWSCRIPFTITMTNRAKIIAAVARARVPAVYWNSRFVSDGGLMCYGTYNYDLHRRAIS